MNKPTVINPPSSLKLREKYDGIPGMYWGYSAETLKIILNANDFAKVDAYRLNAVVKDWMKRRIAYLKMKELLENGT